MTTLEEIKMSEKKTFQLWLIKIITVCSAVVAIPLIFLLIHLNSMDGVLHGGERTPKKQPTIEMTPMTSITEPRINIKMQKTWRKKVFIPELTESILQ